MYSTIIPWTMDLAGFVMIIILLVAGQHHDLQGVSILTLNTTAFKTNYTKVNRFERGPPVLMHDIYRVYMTTYCFGNYYNVTEDGSRSNNETNHLNTYSIKLNTTCAKPKPHFKFLPADIIKNELNPNSTESTNSTENTDEIGEKETRLLPLAKLVALQDEYLNIDPEDTRNEMPDAYFPKDIQTYFKGAYNRRVHIAFICYIVGLVYTAIALLVGIAAFKKGSRGFILTLFTFPAGLFLCVSSAIITIAQYEIDKKIRDLSKESPTLVQASYGDGFIIMTWLATMLILSSTGAWIGASIVSWDYRKNKRNKKAAAEPPQE